MWQDDDLDFTQVTSQFEHQCKLRVLGKEATLMGHADGKLRGLAASTQTSQTTEIAAGDSVIFPQRIGRARAPARRCPAENSGY